MKTLSALVVGFTSLMGLSALVGPRQGAAGQEASDLSQKAQAILTAHCGKCHGMDATAGFSINDRATMIARGQIKPSDPVHSRAYIRAVLTPDDPMPPRSQNDALSLDEQATLKKWIEAGAKATEKANSGSRKFVSTEAVYAAIQADLAKADERDRQYLRYFTLTHLYNAGVSDDDLHAYSLALSKLLNSLSWQKRIAVPQPVDTTQTILRIDMRHYSWTSETWHKLLAVYPYAVVAQTASARSVCASTGCDLPCVRADWFVARTGQPLLYHDLLDLPRTVHELEAKLLVDVDKNIREETAVRAGFGESGVSRNNRIVERHESAYGAYWRSYDFSSSAGQQNIFQHPLAFEPAGGEIIFSLPNGLQGYMLTNGKGERINTGPVEIVSNKENTSDPVVRNGLTCMTCHTRGLKRFNDQMRAVVEKTPTPDFDRNKALALYAQPARFASLMEEDSKRFAASVRETGAEVSDAEPIVALAAKYDAPLNLTQAAAEVGLNAEALQTRLKENAPLGSLLAVLRTPGGQIKRDAWEQSQEDVATQLALGVYLAPRISVGKNGDGQFASIAEAIRSVHSGARIFISPGTYNESLVIDKPVELVSSGKAGEVRIETTGKSCVSVQANGVTIRGITLHTQGLSAEKPIPAVEITSGRLTLLDCSISSDAGAGISVLGNESSLVAKNCAVHQNKVEGILVSAHAKAQCSECDVYDNTVANVSAKAGGSVSLRHCKLHHSACEGVYAAEESHVVLEDCEVGNNGWTGATVTTNSTATFTRSHFHDNKGDGLWVSNSHGNMEDCTSSGNTAAGVSISDGTNMTLMRCQVHHNLHDGVWIGRTGRGEVEDCSVSDNGGAGIVLYAGRVVMRGCHLNNNQLAGVWAQNQSDAEIWRCDLTANKEGTYKAQPGSKMSGGANKQ